ncbi:hypothetical protein O6H91_02G144800 [Diphasiastrum complanatum]|uniref:Uncharacterized protein n=5 Tax=Diphasiastrum complanatum TaxID=34168 RepID=A0ACC2ELC1_DIPCM|nr:hypothetical protein O6H91_02G144700 [Diphasiastrum complanatum]KAJ7567387.1 hypothetical protein O6H91_02G144800 [Diphasiastrum complanatum]KAJ7567388.1 hypothetical protein O6H91_02G144800 [Diphasiastrum complanatum]KAJ7567389.1 hypothetical protein O6H91_02G144800 [Diphasiastrum complanatum]KAJ7567390.1 hypothetical protein O6H91_02G144800 [Diphasiastrum complanatum]
MAKRSIALLIVIMAFLVAVAAGFDGTQEFAACNVNKLSAGSPLFSVIGKLLSKLIRETPYNGYDYKTSVSGNGQKAYGEGTCNQSISVGDCGSCLKYLADNIWGICSNAVGARVQLHDCYIRYETYSF